MIQATFTLCSALLNWSDCTQNKKFNIQQLQSIGIENVPLRQILLPIIIEMTTEFKETNQFYMKEHRHGKKILPQTTN